MPDDDQTESAASTVARWISAVSIPFDGDSNASLYAAIDHVVASLGEDVRVLGFGEGLHGGEEFLQLRNRIFQRLVEAHGYRAIAIESDFARGRLISGYVAGHGPECYDELIEPGFSYQFGQLQANRELIEWMRAWNADPNREPIDWHAFDIPATHDAHVANPRLLLAIALDFLAGMDVAGTGERRARIASLLGDDADWAREANWRPPDPSPEMLARLDQLRIETEELISALQTGLPELSPAGGERRYQEALQHAVSARQVFSVFAALTRSGGWGEVQAVRDRLMAEQIAYIASRTSGKVFVFAHNAHLQCGRVIIPQESSGGYWPAGAHLRHNLGERYAVIGTALGRSDEHGVEAPEPGTLESLLVSETSPAVLLPASRSANTPVDAIGLLPARSPSASNPSYRALDARSFSHFDWLLMVNEVEAVRLQPANSIAASSPD